jgi:hypothetical protein
MERTFQAPDRFVAYRIPGLRPSSSQSTDCQARWTLSSSSIRIMGIVLAQMESA